MKTEPLSRDRAGAVNAGDLVLECERARCRALVEGDIASIEAMLAEELVYVHAPGTVHNKEQLLEFLRTRVRYQSVQRGRLAVHANADVTWTTGLMKPLETRDNG